VSTLAVDTGYASTVADGDAGGASLEPDGEGWSFQILGALEARCRGTVVALGGVKQQSVLAILLLEAGRPVPVNALITGLWGVDAPFTTTATLQVHIANLRKALTGSMGVDQPSPLKTRSPGYVLQVPSSSVDVHEFRRVVRQARLAVDVDSRRELLRHALAKWHGNALSGLEDQPFARSVVAYLAEERLEALEQRVQADLDAGEHAGLVSELRELTDLHPLRETYWAQLMLALYRCGRQAEALSAYRAAREQLVDELGLEPGPELRQLEADVLRQADDLSWVAVPKASGTGTRTTVVHPSEASTRAATLTWPSGRIVLSDICSLGREGDNSISLEDPEASRHHASIRRTSDGFLFVDQRSTNGSFVNGERVSDRMLADGDVIRVGQVELMFAEDDLSLQGEDIAR
jgi:DNA-binding SARP family transcriptional activator